MLQTSKRSWMAAALDFTGCSFALRQLPTWRGLLILNYHRIGDPAASNLDRNLWSATPAGFDAQLAILQKEFDVVGLPDLDRALQNRRGRSVMITFDDGYRDNYAEAFPILRRHGLPATFFLTTGFLDRPVVPWWDEIAWMVRQTRVPALAAIEWTGSLISLKTAGGEPAISRLLRIYKELDGTKTADYLEFLASALQTGRCPAATADELWMTWDMVREMRDGGMTFGGHSVTHPILSRISVEQQDFEVGECRRRLLAELGKPIEAFSYPVGGGGSFNQITTDAVARNGYQWGFTYLGGYLTAGQFDRYALRRTAIETNIGSAMFRSLLALPQFFA